LAINLQLLGGIWILQTFPSIVFGLYTRWFHRFALLAGWAAGMAYGTVVAYGVAVPGRPGSHFGGATATVPVLGQKAYIALTAFVLNIAVVAVLTVVFRATGVPAGNDRTADDDYLVDAGEADVRDLPEVIDVTDRPDRAAPSPAPETTTSPGRSPT
jgi:solute:Na+ symporter, SSS family